MTKKLLKIERLNGSDYLIIPPIDKTKCRTQIITMVNCEEKTICEFAETMLQKYNKDYSIGLTNKPIKDFKSLLLQDLEEDRQSLTYFVNNICKNVYCQFNVEIDEFTKYYKFSFVLYTLLNKEEENE